MSMIYGKSARDWLDFADDALHSLNVLLCSNARTADSMSLFSPYSIADEYGRPFIILKEQQAKARIKGLEAQKVMYGSRVTE